MTTIAKESGHWYTKDGQPAYEQPNKSKPGEMRPTTKRDAKKLDLVPSVTTITSVVNKIALNKWKERQILESAYTCPLKRSEVDSKTWLDRVMKDAEEQAETAREKGTIKHGEIENAFRGGHIDPESDTGRQYLKIIDILKEFGIADTDIEPEKSFACGKYGGKMDLPAIKKHFMGDVKTTEFTLNDGKPSKTLRWPEHIQQIAGYGYGNGISASDIIPVNFYLSTLDDSVWYYRWSSGEYVNGLDQFLLMVDLWYALNY